MTDDLVKVEGDGPARRIVLNRPDVSNAFNTDMLASLAGAIDAAVSDDDVRVIVLAAEGRNFQSGMELASLESLGDDVGAIAETIYALPHRISRALRACPKPTIAAIQGAALTMGCEFSLFCDFRIVTPETFFEEKWVRMGVLPALGGLQLLPGLVGEAHAKRMVLRGERIYGPEAVQIGLATRCVEADALADAARELAEELTRLAAGAYAKAKALLQAAPRQALDDVLAAGARAQAELLTSEEFRARLRRR